MARRKHPQPHGPGGRFTAERTQTTTTVTERVTIDHDDTLTDLSPLPWFAGPSWDTPTAGHARREHLTGQVANCLDHLETWAESAPPGTQPPDVLIREATVILRAGPAATPLELTRGRIA